MPLHSEARQITLTEPSQLSALGHPVRSKILELVGREAMSAKGLADLLDMTHGKVGHHLRVLADAGLIEVIEERPVRAVVEKFYRTTYEHLHIDAGPGDAQDPLKFMLRQAALEALPHDQQPFRPTGRIYSARIDPARAEEFAHRLIALADEFAAGDQVSGPTFGLVGAVYQVDVPS